MKIRFRESSLRFRLDEEEISHLNRHEEIMDECIFSAADSLQFIVRPWHLNVPDVRFLHHQIIVHIPNEDAVKLAADESLSSLNYSIENGQAKPLALLIEKDFPCMHDNKGEK
jgi:hypothetical protein